MSVVVNVPEARVHLSELIDRVHNGEKVVIAKSNVPIADLIPHQSGGKRKLGFLKGELDAPDQVLLDADEEIEDMFYGDDG